MGQCPQALQLARRELGMQAQRQIQHGAGRGFALRAGTCLITVAQATHGVHHVVEPDTGHDVQGLQATHHRRALRRIADADRIAQQHLALTMHRQRPSRRTGEQRVIGRSLAAARRPDRLGAPQLPQTQRGRPRAQAHGVIGRRGTAEFAVRRAGHHARRAGRQLQQCGQAPHHGAGRGLAEPVPSQGQDLS